NRDHDLCCLCFLGVFVALRRCCCFFVALRFCAQQRRHAISASNVLINCCSTASCASQLIVLPTHGGNAHKMAGAVRKGLKATLPLGSTILSPVPPALVPEGPVVEPHQFLVKSAGPVPGSANTPMVLH